MSVTAASPASERFDVAIVGLGPTGATAAALLGQRGIRTVVLERDPDVFPRQRAIAADEDALRVWQSLGLLDQLLLGMETDVRAHFADRGRVFLSFELAESRGQGVPGTAFFHQPELESILRAALLGLPCVEVRVDAQVVGLEQSDEEVVLRTADGAGQQAVVRARYVIGADGGSSSVRKLLGIGLPGRSIEEPWYDVQVRGPQRQIGSPLDFTFIADTHRPGVDCPCPGGYHRYEFRLRPGETPEQIGTPDGLRRILAERGVDYEALEIYRHWAYTFHIRQAERWQQGRVFLAGDAAHIMPPFGGQGISSGVRDAANLTWKLAAVLQAGAPPALLASYETERRPNVMRHTRNSLTIGAIVMTQRPRVAAIRNAVASSAMRTPGFGSWLRRHPLKALWTIGTRGFVAKNRSLRSPAGRFVKQPRLVTNDGQRVLLDDVLGHGWAWVTWRGVPVPAAVARRNIRVVEIDRRHSSWHDRTTQRLVDEEGLLTRQLGRAGCTGVLVRPDRFIYASDRDDLDDLPAWIGSPDPVSQPLLSRSAR